MYKIWIFLFKLALSSTGDESDFFKECHRKCLLTFPSPYTLNPLSLLRWTPYQSCNYLCMFEHLEIISFIPQYHGKWPFYSVLGLVELASVLFSLGNLSVNYYYLRKLKKGRFKSSFYRKLLVFYTYISINTWIWSAVFHSRDTFITQVLDYFSAFATLLLGLFVSIYRSYLYKNKTQIKPVRNCFAMMFCLHLIKMMFSFDFGYNIIVSGIIGISQNALWFNYALKGIRQNPGKTGVKYVNLLKFSVLMTILPTLEILDFAPIAFLIDAHSLWHLSTIFAYPYLYKFFLEDLRDSM